MKPETTRLTLPSGGVAELCGDPADISVFAAVRASGGKWEPHLSHLFKSIVPKDGVCLDIGANIGCHALGLASLAIYGAVWAIEASPHNFQLLEVNAARLVPPCAPIRCEHLAISDHTGELTLSTIEELAGCSFVSDGGSAMDSEQKIRAQVPEAIIGTMELAIHIDPVRCVTLDHWCAARALTRLDVIKMDIEGCERRALLGARETLRRLQPVLVTEYNPRCAELYWHEEPSAYFELLLEVFDDIRQVRRDGLGPPLTQWESANAAIQAGPGWIDLVCRTAR